MSLSLDPALFAEVTDDSLANGITRLPHDAYWELGIAPWDGAAGHLLVREAGGRVTDPFGRDSTPGMGLVVASNGHIHDAFRTVVESWMPMRLVDP